VGLNEEFFKAFAAVILLRRLKDFNEPADALVYSMTVALGFAMLENIEYVPRYGFFSVYVRQFNAVPLHLGLAAIWGMGIAKAKFLNGVEIHPHPCSICGADRFPAFCLQHCHRFTRQSACKVAHPNLARHLSDQACRKENKALLRGRAFQHHPGLPQLQHPEPVPYPQLQKLHTTT